MPSWAIESRKHAARRPRPDVYKGQVEYAVEDERDAQFVGVLSEATEVLLGSEHGVDREAVSYTHLMRQYQDALARGAKPGETE